jgi:putative glutamine amidotransferase
MTRPLIGITIGPAEAGSPFVQQRATYPNAIAAAGGLPVLVPPVDSDSLVGLLQRLDGLLIPGGADVNPRLYGQERHPRTEFVDELDTLELPAARWAVEHELPTLGICRGQQLLNVAAGGTLIQHVEAHRQPGDRQALTQPLRLEPGSRLAAIFGAAEIGANHMHHQAVDQVGRGLQAVAWATDGTIEGLESREHPWLLMVQFHPEELFGFHEPSQRLFDAFVTACREGALSKGQQVASVG